jgi:8-oxo-dGTP pyrophosphatase MutT (NUDIX family)
VTSTAPIENESRYAREVLRVPRQVLVYLFRRSDGDRDFEFLMLRRTAQFGGFWQGVSGAPEWQERDDQGAIREVREETGFDIAASFQQIGVRYELRREDDLDGAQWEELYGPQADAIPEEVYVAEVLSSADPVLAPYEHDAFRWCSFDDALALLRWESRPSRTHRCARVHRNRA